MPTSLSDQQSSSQAYMEQTMGLPAATGRPALRRKLAAAVQAGRHDALSALTSAGVHSTTQGLMGWQHTHLRGNVEAEVWIVIHLLVP